MVCLRKSQMRDHANLNLLMAFTLFRNRFGIEHEVVLIPLSPTGRMTVRSFLRALSLRLHNRICWIFNSFHQRLK